MNASLRTPKMKLKELAQPILIIIAILLALAVMTATGFAKIESFWFIFPFSGIRISTLTAALVCFTVVLFLQKKHTWKSIYYAFLAFIVPMALFEVFWYYSAALLNHWDWRIMQFVALFGWILLGIREVYRTRPPRISLLFYAFFIFSFAIWLGTGFKFNDLNSQSFSLSAEALNVFSKTALFFAFALHIGYLDKGKS